VDSLTVVIPTYNRAGVLKKALDGYLAQRTLDAIHELLVVDDGSTDETESVVDEISRRAPFPVRYFRQENKGPAAARNVGIREAKADVILFTDSDIVPHQDLVEQHLSWHRQNPETSTAVLGYVTWPPEPPPTPFMRWYGERGPLFAYSELRGKLEVDCRYFYTCNLSLKVQFLKVCGQFDEDFKEAAFEDIELGYRLRKAGLKLLYNPGASAYHHQFFSFEEACRKARANRKAARIYVKKEAGAELNAHWMRKESRLTYRIARWAATQVATNLKPARRMLDSALPLPTIIYRLFFWYHGISGDND
jgi:glycosyltransferase involved in cell wall biosynthesis